MRIAPEIEVLKHQAEFAVNTDPFCAIVGGFGSGKSQGAVFRALDRLKRRDYAIYVLIAPTNLLLEDVNIPDFIEVFDHYRIRYELVGGTGRKRIIVNSGGLTGEVWFRSGDKPEKIVGFDATDIDIDEFDIMKPVKQKELWNKALARLRGCDDGTLSVSTTPEGFRFTYEKFEKEKAGPIIRAKTTDNHFLPDSYIENLFSQYDDMLVEQYINAKFVNINGLMAYYAFDRQTNHRTTNPNEHEQYGHIGVGMDFNVNKMCAELFLHNEHKETIHFFDEFIIKGAFGTEPPTERMCRLIRERYPNHQIWVYPDSTGKRKTTNAPSSDLALIRSQKGFRVVVNASNPFVRDRLLAVNKKLGDKSLTVDTDKCPDLTEDLERVERDEHGDIDKSDKMRSHSSDGAGYAVAKLYPVKHRGVSRVSRGV